MSLTVRSRWEVWMNAALLISHAHWVLVVSKGGPHPPLPSSSTFSYPPDCADTYSRCFQKRLGSCEAKQACKAWKLCCWLCGSSFLIHSAPPLLLSPCLSCLLLFPCFEPTCAHISKATLLSLCYAEFLFSTSVTATSPTIFITSIKPDIASLCHVYGLEECWGALWHFGTSETLGCHSRALSKNSYEGMNQSEAGEGQAHSISRCRKIRPCAHFHSLRLPCWTSPWFLNNPPNCHFWSESWKFSGWFLPQ